ncbi:hypothetical protein E5Q_02453 [Mixia osmundae IAM 14324]|uniref:EF-hand domain-containing protein n=1 Tax=Mixia osmundae (strain CBS 9802 / IAM 14324 / JCM 22182 / KY 12970) TaxID=764103 RepID=G7DYY6_MIXOS|nr:hypothetical protein E5Q_02453 [Mixia osmundae IAM 14324]
MSTCDVTAIVPLQRRVSGQASEMVFNPARTKVQLKLASQRSRMLAAKQEVLSKKSRREIATLLERGKMESARIRTETVIANDISIELLELMDLYCELLTARFGLLETQREVDAGIAEAVNGIIYAAPRTELRELHVLRELLMAKYGREHSMAVMDNRDGIVTERVTAKLKVETPSRELVDLYLLEIAKAYGIETALEPPALESPGRPSIASRVSQDAVKLPQVPALAPADEGPTITIKTSLPSAAASPTIKPDEAQAKLDDLAKRFEALRRRETVTGAMLYSPYEDLRHPDLVDWMQPRARHNETAARTSLFGCPTMRRPRWCVCTCLLVLAQQAFAHGGEGHGETKRDASYAERHMASEHHIDTFDLASFFHLHDLNRDGILDQDELTALYGVHHETSKSASKQQERSHDDKAKEIMDKVMATLDLNKDGVVTKAEFLSVGKEGLPDFKEEGLGHHYDVEGEYYLHHEELYHNTPDTQEEGAYTHKEDLEHFTRHEAIERAEADADLKAQGLPPTDPSKPLEEQLPHDTKLDEVQPAADQGSQQTFQTSPNGSENAKSGESARRLRAQAADRQIQKLASDVKEASKRGAYAADGRFGKPRDAADRMRRNIPYKYRLKSSWFGDF